MTVRVTGFGGVGFKIQTAKPAIAATTRQASPARNAQRRNVRTCSAGCDRRRCGGRATFGDPLQLAAQVAGRLPPLVRVFCQTRFDRRGPSAGGVIG